MEFKWYWLAKVLGLVTDISAQSNNEYTYRVSAQTGDVFATLFLLMIPALFVLGALLRAAFPDRGGLCVKTGAIFLLLWGVLQAVGVGPYVQFYPQGSGFLDLSTLEHILSGLYCTLLALSLFFGGRFGSFLRNYCKKRGEKP